MREPISDTIGPAVEVQTREEEQLLDHTERIGAKPENALLNLCINARDAMPNGGRITIETSNCSFDQATARERELRPGDYVSLTVSDNGTGM